MEPDSPEPKTAPDIPPYPYDVILGPEGTATPPEREIEVELPPIGEDDGE